MRIYTGLDVTSDFGGRFPWTSRFVDHGGVRQAYVDEGLRDAAVTFLCLHGNPTWGFLYREFIQRLAARHRVIAGDHVGFGRSDKPRDPAYYTIERHVMNLERLLRAVGASNNVIPIIHDWGGPIGMGWATRHPEAIAAVVVLNTTAFVKDPVPNIPFLSSFPFDLLTGGWKRAVDNNFFVEWFVGRFGTVRKMTMGDLDPYRAPFPTPADRMGMARMPNIWEGGNPGYETYAGAVATEEGLSRLRDKPALICWGLRDRGFTRRHLARWQRVFTGVDGPHLFPNAAHFLQEDAASEILDHVERWLATRVPERLVGGTGAP
jgi:haloalkane dehalogenase